MRIKRRTGIGSSVVTAVVVALLSISAVTPFVQKAEAVEGSATPLSVEIVSNTALSFVVSEPSVLCALDTALAVTGNGIPVTPVELIEVDANTLSVTLPNDSASPLVFTLTCLDAQENPITSQGDVTFFSMPVTKTIEGDVPADAAFTVNVACIASIIQDGAASPAFQPLQTELPDVLSIDLAFGAEGGVKYVFGYRPYDCVVTETADGGASMTTITPPTVNTGEPGIYPVEVINMFVARPRFTG